MEFTRGKLYSLLLATVVLFHESYGCSRVHSPDSPDGRDTTRPGMGAGAAPCASYVCGKCGFPIDVTLAVRNQLVEPKFDFNITLSNQPQRELIYFLEKAAQLDSRFAFSGSYHSVYGYFISKIGGQEQSVADSYYWILSDIVSGSSLMTGLSAHVPNHQEMILFNLTSYGH